MKKKVCVFILAVVVVLSSSIVAFAQEHQLVYDVAFDSEKNVVTVGLSVENAIGLEAADFNLAFDENMFEYVDYEESDVESEAMVIAGKAATETGLATCSVIFMDACSEADLNDEGRLELVTFIFKPRAADYDLDDFCYWASSYTAEENNVIDSLNVVGKQDLMEDRTDSVTYVVPTADSVNTADTTKGGTEGISGSVNSNWYVYLIAGVLAVAAIAGIAAVVIKKNRKEENGEDVEKKNDSDNQNA